MEGGRNTSGAGGSGRRGGYRPRGSGRGGGRGGRGRGGAGAGQESRDPKPQGSQSSGGRQNGAQVSDKRPVSVLPEGEREPKRPKHEAHLSATTFASLEGISPLSKKAIAEVLKFERLSLVQDATLPRIMAGRDVLAKAKTGTGKTVGFLLPSLERVIAAKQGATSQKISMLVISPTRELASQIAAEATQLCTFHKSINVAVFVGGLSMNKDINVLKGSIDILVATPGRLLDHLANTPNVSSRLSQISVLVLDEADQLLEQGFRIELEKIM